MAVSFSRKRILLASTLLTASFALPLTANAQERIRERIDTDRVLDTVEVTAQKRAENLQDVPVAIQTFDAEGLAVLKIDGFDDLATFTPGLTASPNPADSSGLRLSIRGIGQDDPQIGLDATVGLYVNGVYIGKTPGLSFDTPDLERIEVLKGPQGTLYGRNAVAGAINIITKGAEIGEGFSGNATLEAGNFDTFGYKGSVNIPLGDTAAVKLSGLVFEREGYVENVPTNLDLVALTGNPLAGFLPQGEGTNFGGVDRTGLNLDFAWQATPSLLLEYGFDSSNSKNEPFFQQLVPNTDGSFGFLQAPTLAGPLPLVPVTAGFQREAVSTVPIRETETDTIGHRFVATYDWNDNHTSKLTGAYRRSDTDAFTSFFPEINPFVLGGVLGAGTIDPTAPSNPATNPSTTDLLGTVAPGLLAMLGVDVRADIGAPFNASIAPPLFDQPFTSFGAGAAGGIPTLDNHEQFSLEYTQTGEFGERFQYTAGLFYFDEDTAAGFFRDRPGDALGLAQLLPVLQLLQPIQVAAMGGPGDLMALTDQAGSILAAARSPGARIELDTKAFAAYGELTYQVTDQIAITGGLRYSRDNKDAFQQGVSPFFNDTTNLQGNPIQPLLGDETFDSLDPKVVIEYTPTDDLLIYASYSQAFRSGGFNQSSVNLSDFVFDEEKIRSGEIGAKSDLFNGRVRLNANVFASFVDNQQFTFTNPAIPVARFIENNDAEFIGFEVDGQVVLGDYMTASFSYAFLDAEADEFINPFTGQLAGGVDNAPKNSYAINLDYNRPVGPGDLAAHLGFNHKDATSVIGVPRTNSNLLDARLGYTLGAGEKRQVTLFVYGQNLTDDEYTIDGLDVLSAVIGTTNTFGLPRTYGAGITVAF